MYVCTAIGVGIFTCAVMVYFQVRYQNPKLCLSETPNFIVSEHIVGDYRTAGNVFSYSAIYGKRRSLWSES